MHVLITINSSWNVLNFRKALVSALLADGHDVTILAPREPAAEELEVMGCRVVHLEMDRKGLSPIRDLGLFLRLARHFRRLRPDLVLGYTIKNNIYGALACRMLGVPFVPNVTGLGTVFIRKSAATVIAIFLYRLAFRGLARVFVQNGDDRELFLRHRIVRPEQLAIVPGSGIDLDRFAPAPLPNGDRVVFLLIGRMLRDKGIREYVDAARMLLSTGITARFRLLGVLDADNRSAIGKDAMDAWVSEGVVEYMGSAADIRSAIRDADCIVLPSYREGAPRTLLEGAAMGRPLVATDVAGCRHVVEDGVTGLLCHVRDAGDLAAKMAALVGAGPRERARMGAAGRRKMESEYDERLVVAAYREAIADAIR